ncbi:hypothetical protein LB58_23160 [Salmonella enterica]|nr:hypothetical protein [Salmonella enterica]
MSNIDKQVQEATEKLVQERNALAAENAALKSALNDILQPDAAVLERNHRVRALDAMETPATDAFLAEVRAQGVEMMREHPSIKLCSLTHICDELAAQLRKGAAL